MGDVEYAGYIRRVQAGDDSEFIKDSEEAAAQWSGRRAEEMPDNFTCQADRECMTGWAGHTGATGGTLRTTYGVLPTAGGTG